MNPPTTNEGRLILQAAAPLYLEYLSLPPIHSSCQPPCPCPDIQPNYGASLFPHPPPHGHTNCPLSLLSYSPQVLLLSRPLPLPSLLFPPLPVPKTVNSVHNSGLCGLQIRLKKGTTVTSCCTAVILTEGIIASAFGSTVQFARKEQGLGISQDPNTWAK
ncbi:hypothetical protein BGX38DRAFT_201259 [Terfezia claveryi]|nr:hypothetical protein BGX38DRAFT_201259 [Terfezia claveryi]